MKGLLIKDLFTLLKQMKVFLILIVIIPFIPNFPISVFAIVYAAILPVSALAYDERSKWNSFAEMMPYSSKDIVLSKYLLGYILTLVASVLCLVAKIILNKFGFESDTNSIMSIPVVIMISLIMESINLPFMFNFGVEKGRLVLFILTFVIVILSSFFSAIINDSNLIGNSKPVIYVSAILGTVVINIISILISTKLYSNKEEKN